jgi:hypothetical protein
MQSPQTCNVKPYAILKLKSRGKICVLRHGGALFEILSSSSLLYLSFYLSAYYRACELPAVRNITHTAARFAVTPYSFTAATLQHTVTSRAMRSCPSAP